MLHTDFELIGEEVFGQNPIRKQELSDGLTLFIEDIWPTIQGEGPFALLPAIFIRTSGCWLKCFYCDTQFEDGMTRPPLPIDEITQRVRKLAESTATKLVVLTGGDPLRQNTLPLVWRLCSHNFHVQFETAGLQWVPGLESWVDKNGHYPQAGKVTVVCSPKTGKVSREVHRWACAWKYVISADSIVDDDGLPSSSTQIPGLAQKLARPPQEFPRHKIFLQPCDEQDVEKNAANMNLVTQLSMRFGYRMSLQAHKMLGVE